MFSQAGLFLVSRTATLGYVWHCHIVDHEDNEMMRPDEVVPRNVGRTYNLGTEY